MPQSANALRVVPLNDQIAGAGWRACATAPPWATSGGRNGGRRSEAETSQGRRIVHYPMRSISTIAIPEGCADNQSTSSWKRDQAA